jgi:hypothetical protein
LILINQNNYPFDSDLPKLLFLGDADSTPPNNPLIIISLAYKKPVLIIAGNPK